MVTWRSILESVAQILPSMMTLCSDYLKKLAVWESELCKQRAVQVISSDLSKRVLGADNL